MRARTHNPRRQSRVAPDNGTRPGRVSRSRRNGSVRGGSWRSRWRSVTALVLTVFVLNGGVLHAAGAAQQAVAKGLGARPAMTPESAATAARRETGGRVLSVMPLEGGQQGFRIRLLLDGGRVTTVLVGPGGGILSQG